MILEIVIYLVVITVIALSLSLFLETLTELFKTSGVEGKRNIIVSLASICCSYYFFYECMGYFHERKIGYDYWVFLVAGLAVLATITAIRETVKSYLDKEPHRATESHEDLALSDEDGSKIKVTD